jgi:hypothetical protein
VSHWGYGIVATIVEVTPSGLGVTTTVAPMALYCNTILGTSAFGTAVSVSTLGILIHLRDADPCQRPRQEMTALRSASAPPLIKNGMLPAVLFCVMQSSNLAWLAAFTEWPSGIQNDSIFLLRVGL